MRGEGGELEDLMVYRDVYYYWPKRLGTTWRVEIPDGHYVMLGDNTQDSADSRDWESVSFEWTEDGERRRERGNYRLGLDAQNPVYAQRGDGRTLVGFRDLWGERHWFPRSRDGGQSLAGPAPLVPRELIQGRALAVFWPLQPLRKVWRLGWLH